MSENSVRKSWLGRIREFPVSRRMRRIGIALLVAVVVYGLAGFVGGPMLLRHLAITQGAAALHRAVSVGHIYFNPYRLRLEIDKLHVAGRTGSDPFADIAHLRLKVSWSSLYRLAPVIGEVTVTGPEIHIVRNADKSFNFSDLLGPPAERPSPVPATKPLRFAVSNIQLADGRIELDDKALGNKHMVEHIGLDIPFIANLPADVDIFVQPLLQMVVDGSPLRITGKAKPFANPPESEFDLNLHRLDLASYAAYLPPSVPIKLPKGAFSAGVQIHFVNTPDKPLIRVAGAAAIDELDLRDASDSPLLGVNHAVVDFADVEPLSQVAHIDKIYVNGLAAALVRNADGTTNLTPLMGGKPATKGGSPQRGAQPTPRTASAAAPSPRAGTPPAPSSAAPANQSTTADVTLGSFELANSAVKLTDNSAASPVVLSIEKLHVGLSKFQLGGKTPAPFHLNAKIGGGGTIAVKGALDLTGSQVTTDISLDQIDLPALQGFAQSVMAAHLASGKLSAHARVRTDFAAAKFNVHAEPADVALDNFDLRGPDKGETPVAWKQIKASIGQVDLASHQAEVKEVRADGLHVFVRRGKNGELSLESLVRKPGEVAQESTAQGGAVPAKRAKTRGHHRAASRRRGGASPEAAVTAGGRAVVEPKQIAAESRRSRTSRGRGAKVAEAKAGASPPSAAWKYRIASVAIENTELRVEDDSAPKPVIVAVAPLNIHLKDISSDLGKPLKLDFSGTVNRKGSISVAGTVTPEPLKAELRLVSKRLDLAAAGPYLSSRLNATITSAALTMKAAIGVAQVRKDFHINFRGDTTLANLRMLDKVTGDDFLRWNRFSAKRINVSLGGSEPRVHIGALALSNFYARIILNADGKLNLSDITSNPQAAPKSLTRAQPAAGGKAPAPSKSPSAVPAAPSGESRPAAANEPVAVTGKPVPADVEVGAITLQGGHVNYTDNFIKPNYTADLTEIGGKIGGFGTSSTAPATVVLEGQVNGNAPINISGLINPLAPMAFVDIKANADRIELTDLTPYSTKYTGYPIVKGTLTVDVHYLFDQGKLTADNHITIDQLTFGDKVENPSAVNLPIRLAVALLKDSRGVIDLRVPVSGSLSDPQFSVGSVVWHAFLNLIVKAATSPFSLLASAVSGIGGGGGRTSPTLNSSPAMRSSRKPARTSSPPLPRRCTSAPDSNSISSGASIRSSTATACVTRRLTTWSVSRRPRTRASKQAPTSRPSR